MTARYNAQSGSAFFLILIGIFLFAALSYAVMRSSSTSVATLTQEQARVEAQEILSFADTVAKSVQALRLRGCTETQFNFVTPETAGWLTNPTAPADESCDIFSLNGGKVTYQYVPAAARRMKAGNGQWWWFNSQTPVKDIGTSSPELLLWAVDLKPEVCQQINRILLNSDVTTVESVATHTVGFDGTYVALPDGMGDDSNSPWAGKPSACNGNDTQGYGFYSTLIAR